MLNSLVRLWREFSAWMMQRPVSTHQPPVSQTYQPSNLHARHRQNCSIRSEEPAMVGMAEDCVMKPTVARLRGGWSADAHNRLFLRNFPSGDSPPEWGLCYRYCPLTPPRGQPSR
jgi:hypothetical protein